MDIVVLAAAVAGGYVAAIFTWPKVRTFFMGVENEVEGLKARIASLKG